jgi:uncharacterized protein YtpQ (UPF0354 family)
MGLFAKLFGPPSKERFAQIMQRRLRQAGLQQFQYDPRQFAILDGHGSQLLLDNAYAEYCRASKHERESVLKNYISTFSSSRQETPEEFEDAKPDLLPLVRARSFYEVDMQLATTELSMPIPPHHIVADGLAVSLGYDLPHCVMGVTQEMLDSWGVTLFEALEAAKENLKETTKQYAQLGTLYSVINGDNYDASRLILTDFIQGLEVTGDHIAMVPNRESLLIAGSDDQAALGIMLDLAEKEIQHERRITGVAFRLIDGEWAPWLPPAEHPLFARFNMLRVQTVLQDYDNQKRLLSGRLQKEGKDLFVAAYSAFQRQKTGDIRSYCVWSQGVPSLLPRTDLIVLMAPAEEGGAKQAASGSWERVQEVAGYLMERQEVYPERFLVEGFPTAEELAEIGNSELNSD